MDEAAALPAPPFDLMANVAGASARAERDRINGQAPVRNLAARVLGVKTDERSWRVGAEGEERVGRVLARLDASWRCLHAVEVGERGSDIDHVLIGPPGVFTLNTKCHPKAKVWVGASTIMVNGFSTSYLRNSRFEARRASKLLSARATSEIPVHPAIVFVGLESLTVKQQPDDVHVVGRRRVRRWLNGLEPILSPLRVEEIFEIARWNTTWRPDLGAV